MVKTNKTLYALGSSWPWGGELDLSKEKPYPTLIAEQLGYSLVNVSDPGSSISHLLLQAKKCIDEHRSPGIAVVFITEPDRELLFNFQGDPVKVKATRIEQPSKNYYKYIHTKYLAEFRANTIILAVQEMLLSAGITPIFLWGDTRIKVWYCDNTLDFYPDSALEIIGASGQKFDELRNKKNHYIWPNTAHPNQKGHAVIASKLVNYIKESGYE